MWWGSKWGSGGAGWGTPGRNLSIPSLPSKRQGGTLTHATT